MIASGGAGKPEDFVESSLTGCADAALAASIFHYGTYTVGDLKEFLQLAQRPGKTRAMIIPCIDLMDGKVVQLVQGRDKALEGDAPLEMLRKFAAFPQIQVIDLDAAMGKGSECRAGGTGRRAPVAASAAAFAPGARTRADRAGRAPCDRRHRGFHREQLTEIADAVGPERLIVALDSKDGKIVVDGWQEATNFTAEEVIRQLGALLLRLPVHLCG